MQGEAFIEFAGKIAAQPGSGPAGFRSAASRAYYGAFHLLLEFLSSLGHHCNSDNAHLWVRRCLSNCGEPEGLTLGQRIGNLHENRKAADYRLDAAAAETEANARACVLRAVEIRQHLLQCQVEPVRSQIATGIEHYRRNVLKDLA